MKFDICIKRWLFSCFLFSMSVGFYGCMSGYAGSYCLDKSHNFYGSKENLKLIENVVRDVATSFGFIEVKQPSGLPDTVREIMEDIILFDKSNKIRTKYDVFEGSNEDITLIVNKRDGMYIGIELRKNYRETEFIKAFKKELEKRLAEDAHLNDIHFERQWISLT